MLDATAGLVVDHPDKLDERRSGAHVERFGNLAGRKHGADALPRVLDLDPGALEQFEQRPRCQFLLAEGHRNALGNVRGEIGKRHAVDGTHTHRALQQLVRPDAERLRNGAFRRHIVERQELDRRAAAHFGEIGQNAGYVGGHRRRRRPVDHARAGAAAALDQSLAREFAERAPHRDAGNTVEFRQFVLGRQLGAEGGGAAEDAVAQDQINLLCLRLAEPIAHATSPNPSTLAGQRFTWYYLAYIIGGLRQAQPSVTSSLQPIGTHERALRP